MYRWYITKTIKENPDFWTEYDWTARQRGIRVILKKVNGATQVHMTYTQFRSILEYNNNQAQAHIIAGERYKLGVGMGYIQARRVERNFNKPKIDVVGTIQYRRANPEKLGANNKKPVIYHQDEDYCRIGWNKLNKVSNEAIYEFKPCKYFRIAFSRAITDNVNLKFKYLFFPYLKTAQ